jgi:hypothetical protein
VADDSATAAKTAPAELGLGFGEGGWEDGVFGAWRLEAWAMV